MCCVALNFASGVNILLCACLIVDVHILGVSLKLGSTILGASLSEPHINSAAVCDAYLIYLTLGVHAHERREL